MVIGLSFCRLNLMSYNSYYYLLLIFVTIVLSAAVKLLSRFLLLL